MKILKTVREVILNLLFPRRCPVCDSVVPFGNLICDSCRKKPIPIRSPRCLKCGKPIRDSQMQYCRDCSLKKHFFEKGFAAFEYHSIASSLYRFKYAKRQEYAEYYGEEIVRLRGKSLKSCHAQALIPVPLHKKRQRERGYNQAERLAKVIGRKLEIPVERKLLVRVKKTTPQKLLSKEGRQNNLKNAFKITKNDVKLKTVILVDDIYTTGATMDACAQVLKAKGVEKVFLVSVAIGKGL